MHPRVRAVLLLILGLAAGASAFAQDSAPPAGAVVKDMEGTLTIQIGNGPPQPYKPGAPIPVGAIVGTSAGSSVTLVFPDGQICALGANSAFRMTSYSYDPKDPANGQMALNLISGSVRFVMGEIARANPGAVLMQVGVATIGVDASSAPRTDISVVVQGAQVAVAVERGSVVAFLPSGQPQPMAAGQGLFLAQDGSLARGTTAQLVQRVSALPQGQQMQQQFAALAKASPSIADTVNAFSNPASAEKLLAALEALPPTAQTTPPPSLPQFNTVSTPVTGAGSGGTPCGASCN